MPKPKRTSSHPKARKPKPKDTADSAHSGAYYDTMRIVLELGDDLGFLPAPQRLSLARHLQDRGAVVDTVVSDETAFVVSRPMSAEEFDASAALQNAVRHGVPIVGLRYVLRCDEARRALPVADALLPLPEDSRELLGIVSDLRGREALAVAPEVAIAAFANRVPRALYDAAVPVAEAGTPEAVAARTSGVMMEPYSETRAAEQYASDCGVKGAAPPGRDAPPPFPPHRAASTGHGHYAVLRESYDGRVKVELHVAVGPAPCCLLPFRVMRYVGSSGVSGAPVATLQEAEEIYAGLCTGGTAMPPATVGSLEAKQRALFDVSGAALPSVPSAVEGFVQQAFTTAAAFLADRTSLSSQASASGAVVGGVGLGELRKAQAAVVALAELFLAEAKREGNTTGAIVLTDKAALAKAAELTKAYTKVVRAKMAPEVITTSDELAEAEDTVRLLVAMTAVGESSHRNVFAAPLPAQYASLQCLIAHVSGTLENTAAHAALQAWPTGLRRAVKAVYSVRRVDEHIAFQGSVGNTRLLYHGTHAGSLVPILRGGLEVPASARLRRDRGMLGRGIYFAESPTVAARYCGSSGGKLYILVAEVALGTAYDTTQHEYDLARPPLGFDSVHGAPTPGGAFKDHEYVVYAEAQQRLQFVVEIDASALTAADVTSKGPVVTATAAIGAEQDALVPVERVTPLKEQKITVKAPVVGLQAKDETPVPLRRTDIKAQVVDTIAEVTLLQEYFNAGSAPVEAKYVFPLQGGAAVCGFEAFINHKHVVGTVKEKEQARKEYKAAVAAGHGAYLMDESEETPDVFTISVGNLPPKTRVVVKVTYVIELGIDAARNAIEFIIPSHVHPAKAQKELATKTQGSTGTIAAAGAGAVTLELGLDMPFDITAVECSHAVQRKRTACRATVRSDNLAMDGKDFVCAVRLGVMNTPRIWVEEDAAGSKAAMITFFPALDEERAAAEATARSKEVLLLLDASASMAQGDAAKDAKVAALHALATLPDAAVVNAAMFGGRTVHALPKAEPLADCRPRLEAWIQAEYGAVLGVTDIAPVLLGLSAACRDGPNATTELPGHARPRREVDVLLFSDGLLCDEPRVLAVLRAAPSLRVFTVAVGSAACAPSMYAAARAGRGQLAVLRGGAKSRWAAAVERQTARTAQPALTDIAVEWSTEHSARLRRKTNAAVTQSPASVPCVFSGESTVVYGVFPHQARQCELVARHTGAGAERDQYGDWPEERFLVTATGTSFRTGALVHRLAAKARIRDWTDGSLLDLAAAADDAVASTTEATAVGAVHNEAQKAVTKQAIIGLGCRYGLVTPFTSMVAVEERTDEERAEQGRGKGEAACTTPAVAALSAHVAVDPIPEVSYLEEHLPWDRLPPLPKAQAPAAAPALVPVTAWRPPKAGVPLPTAALPPPRRDTYAVVSHADLRRQAELLGAAAAAQAAPADPGWDRMAAAAREAHERHRTRLAPPDLALPERRPLPMPSMEVDLRPHEATSAGVDPTAGGLLMHDDDFRYAMAHAVSEEYVVDQPMRGKAGGRSGRRGMEGRVPESHRRRRRDRGLGAVVEASESEEEDVYGMDLFGSNVITPAVAAGDRRLMDTRADTRECWAAPEPMLEEATLCYSRAAMLDSPKMLMTGVEKFCLQEEPRACLMAAKMVCKEEEDDLMMELCDEEVELDRCMAVCAEACEFDDDEDEDEEPMATMGGAMNYRQSSMQRDVCLDSDSSSDDSYDEDFCSSVDEAPAARGARGGRGGFLGLVGSRGRGGPPMGGEGRGRGRGGPPPAPPRPEASGYGGPPPPESFKKSSGKLFVSAFGAAPAAAAPSAPPPPPPPAPAGFAASSAPCAPPPPPGAPVPMAAAAAAPRSTSAFSGAPMPSAPMAFGAAPPPPPPTASFAQQPSPQQQQQQQQPQARGFGAPAGGFGAPPGKGGASFGQGGGGPSKPMSSVASAGFGAAPKARPDTAMRSRAAPTSMSDRNVTRTEACDDRMQSLQSSLSRRRSSAVERERGVTINLQRSAEEACRRSAEVEECQRMSANVEQALMQQREQLEALSCRSEQLQASAQMFRHKSKKKERKMKERHFDKCDAAGESPSPTAPAPVAVGPADPLVSVPGRTSTPPLPFEASPLPPPAPVIKPVPGRNGVEIAVFAAATEPLLTIPAAACLPTTARATVRLSEAAEVRVVERVLDTSSPLYAQTAGPGLLRVAVHVAGDRSVTVTAEVDGTHAPASVVIKDRIGRGDVAAVVDRDAALWAVVMGHQASAVVTGLPAHASEQWLREVMPSLTSCAVARCPATGLATGTAAIGWASISGAVASLKSAVAAAPQWQWRLFNSGEDIASALCAWTPLRGETLEAVLHAAGVQAGPAANRVLTAVFGTTDVSSSQASVLRAAVNEVGQRCGAHIAAREPLPVARLDAVQRALCEESSLGLGTLLYPYPVRCVPSVAWPDRGVPCATQPEDRYCYGAEVGYRTVDDVYAPALATVC